MSIIVSLHSDPAFFYLLLIFQIYSLILYILIPFVNVLAHMSTFYYLLPTRYCYYYSYCYYFLSCVTLTQNDRRGDSVLCDSFDIYFTSCILFYFDHIQAAIQ
ncbi:hypothetical protein BO83DRAFT_192951 [Aspergillus eucalypticola CBS 122712]|uniref:Uncharacterized protein n=1 Tax=Aspergillus eucalypticola (strain CBS 122712 / IBT 29274) TaxID=1448314 RepID=A0A317UL12_ASPEC|nr:uncharacterized protein BO83DRAFT_192951 [Aspergillus eucalypticola CBS 122712]PWY62135.1 hypothetical protein BO83DRAFT_192951 [Aspergillus eucalypticola CBS 122712]